MAHVIVMHNGSMRLEPDGRAEVTVVDQGEKSIIRLTRSQMVALVDSWVPMEMHRREVEHMQAQIAQTKR
jgi:hypothetical protein